MLHTQQVCHYKVLIESDWNLKDTKDCIIVVPAVSINRIRLEFKGKPQVNTSVASYSINRIRLEFKGFRHVVPVNMVLVLIESDWNLK